MLANDRAKASAFVEEYAKISVRQSDKDYKKAVMDLRCLTRSTSTSPRLQIEEVFTPFVIQQVLSQLKAVKEEGSDGIAPNLLRHLSPKGSCVLLSILSSS